jgi:hypothetical protein
MNQEIKTKHLEALDLPGPVTKDGEKRGVLRGWRHGQGHIVFSRPSNGAILNNGEELNITSKHQGVDMWT